MQVNESTIGGLIHSNRKLEIPFFQRRYVWKEENWEFFWEDIQEYCSENKQNFFMGSIILKQQPTKTDETIGDVRIVIDGQQRLTTFLIFLRVLADSQGESERKMFKQMYINEVDDTLVLQHNHHDKEAFEKILRGESKQILHGYTAGRKEGKIYECYMYFYDRINDFLDQGTLQSLIWNDVLRYPQFVLIDLNEKEDEQQIFDTMNSRGVSLSVGDLLKNHLFEENELDLYNKSWKETFEAEGEASNYWLKEVNYGRAKRSSLDMFLQAYLVSITGKETKIGQDLYKGYREVVKEQDRRAFIDTFIQNSKQYRSNIDPDCRRKSIEKATASVSMQRLNLAMFGFKNSTLLPYVLYILLNQPEAKEQADVFSLLVNYLLRRAVYKAPSQGLSRYIATLVREEVKEHAELLSRMQTAQGLIAFPNDEAIRQSISQKTYTNDSVKTILYLIEHHLQQDERHVKHVRELSKYELEHIMPKKWEENWGELGKENASARNRAVQTLGNLTLLTKGLNRKLRHAAWPVKRKEMQKYCTGLMTFEAYLKFTDWNEKRIAERNTFLCDKIITLWPDITQTPG